VNDRPHSEDLAIQDVLAALEPAAAGSSSVRSTGPVSPAAPPDDALSREYLEALALLALEAEPVAPRPETKARLMAAIAGVDRDAPEPATPSAPVPFESRRREAPAVQVGRAPWWSLAAAVLALAAFGLAGMLWVELGRSRGALAQLEQEQQRLVGRIGNQEAMVHEVVRLGSMVTVASTPGVEICPLRPVGERPVAPGAFAVLYMPPGQMDWYLVATNLKPAPDGVYKVWLNTDDGSMPGGVMESNSLTSGQMSVRIPPGVFEQGKMLSVTITLEPAAEVEAPSGPMVLFGDEKMQVI